MKMSSMYYKGLWWLLTSPGWVLVRISFKEVSLNLIEPVTKWNLTAILTNFNQGAVFLWAFKISNNNYDNVAKLLFAIIFLRTLKSYVSKKTHFQSQPFFQVFYDKMRDSQQEIKSTVTVNTSDMAAKAHEDKDSGKELDKINKKKGMLRCDLGYLAFSIRDYVVFAGCVFQKLAALFSLIDNKIITMTVLHHLVDSNVCCYIKFL